MDEWHNERQHSPSVSASNHRVRGVLIASGIDVRSPSGSSELVRRPRPRPSSGIYGRHYYYYYYYNFSVISSSIALYCDALKHMIAALPLSSGDGRVARKLTGIGGLH